MAKVNKWHNKKYHSYNISPWNVNVAAKLQKVGVGGFVEVKFKNKHMSENELANASIICLRDSGPNLSRDRIFSYSVCIVVKLKYVGC